MSYAHFERLTALDATFLAVEDHSAHMHVGAVALFDAAPLTGTDGAIDMERIRRVIEVGLHRVPRYQQRLSYVPLFGYPVWVDDGHFNLNYHVRHVALPKPGDLRTLKRLAGRIMSQQLDRGKPLWELWVVEGVEGNRLGLITKAHHCMIDGVGSVELSTALMRATPEIERRLDNPPKWVPRPAPTRAQLLAGELQRRAAEPLAALRAAADMVLHPTRAARAVEEAILGIGSAVGAGLQPASPTPLNIAIGPHRRFDWLDMDLAAVKEIKDRLGGTVNDVVLTVASGALGRFLHGRGMPVDDLDFRAMIPVNVRTTRERERMGNRITMMVGRLPIGEHNARQRLEQVMKSTAELKRSRQSAGVRTLEDLGDLTASTVFTAFARLSTVARPYNVVITNVPGPQFASYFLGSPMQAVYPLVPLNRNQALGIALFSYNGGLYWGFNADWDAVPDLHDLVEAVATEFEALRSAAAAAPAQPLTPPARKAARRTPRRRAARHLRRAS